MKILLLQTSTATDWVDLTKQLAQITQAEGWKEGLLTVFSPHTTASITINEGWDPAVTRDLSLRMNELFAEDPRFQYAEGNSHAHLKTSLFHSSQSIIVSEGVLQLGQWQKVFFVDWDGPRSRKIFVQFIAV